MFQIARGSGATLNECTFFFKKAHVTKKTSLRKTTSRPHDKKNSDRSISEFFLIKNPGICSEPFDEESEQFQDKTLQLLVPNSKRLEGYTMGVLFLPKSTHHSKIPGNATWFHSRKHSGDACSCSTRPGGTRQGFRSSTMKCSGACRCGTHGIPRKEERRSSLIRIPPM